MSAIRTLRTAVDALSPVLLVGGLCYALVLLPQRALQLAGVPLAPALLQLVTFFVTPFVLAGVIGMAREALDGDTSLGSFTSVGKDRYLDLLLGTFVEFGIQLAFGVGFFVLALVAAIGGAAADGAGPLALLGVALVVFLVLAYLAVLFCIQFYPVVIVIDGAGPIEGVTESVDFVRNNIVSTLGFSAITVLLGLLAKLPVQGVATYHLLTSETGGAGETPDPIGGGMSPGTGAGSPELTDLLASGGGLGLSTPEVVALSLVSLVTTALFVAFRQTYATAFYQHNGRSVEERVLGDEL